MEVLSLLDWLATPVPLLGLSIALVIARVRRDARTLRLWMIAWTALTIAGMVWFYFEPQRLADPEVFAPDPGFIGTINVVILGFVGLFLCAVAQFSMKFKSDTKET